MRRGRSSVAHGPGALREKAEVQVQPGVMGKVMGKRTTANSNDCSEKEGTS